MVTFLLPLPQELPPQHSNMTLVSPCAFTPPEKLNIKKVSKGSGCLMRTLLLGSFPEKQKNPRKSLGREPDAHSESHK